jgi:caffeoyl-CoA O-methyltransferase
MTDRTIADPALEDYAAAHSTPPSEALERVSTATHVAFSPRAQMLVGSLEGRFLAMLVAISGARRILEIGTFTGYSAIAMAEALPADGRITTLELDPVHAETAAKHIEAAGVGDRVEIVRGPAIESLRRLEGPFDIVFIDADKAGYPDYYEAVVPLVRPGGLIVADNVLWSGRVLDAPDSDRDSAALRTFNDLVVHDPRVECVMLTIRDGVTLIRRRP